MFALTWSNTALDQLADVYVAATPDQRTRMASFIDGVNERLRVDPLAVGESRSGGHRIVFVPLLAILFHVSEADRTVRVTRAKRYGK